MKKFYKLKVDETLPANKILGIEEIKKYLDKKISIEQAFEETFIRTRRYVKRQRTWFRGHMKDWISIFHPNFDILTKKFSQTFFQFNSVMYSSNIFLPPVP